MYAAWDEGHVRRTTRLPSKPPCDTAQGLYKQQRTAQGLNKQQGSGGWGSNRGMAGLCAAQDRCAMTQESRARACTRISESEIIPAPLRFTHYTMKA